MLNGSSNTASRRAIGMLVQKDPGSQFDAEDSGAPGGGLGARGSNPGLAALGTDLV